MGRLRFHSGRLCCLLAGLLLSLPACKVKEGNQESGGADLKVGDSLPAFSVRMDSGEVVSDRSLAGTVNLIVFFHTRCSDCAAELPVLQEIWDRYRRHPQVRMVLISRSQPEEEIREYWLRNRLSLPWSAQEDDRIYRKFASSVIPRIYVTDQENTIRHLHTDRPVATEAELMEEIESLL